MGSCSSKIAERCRARRAKKIWDDIEECNNSINDFKILSNIRENVMTVLNQFRSDPVEIPYRIHIKCPTRDLCPYYIDVENQISQNDKKKVDKLNIRYYYYPLNTVFDPFSAPFEIEQGITYDGRITLYDGEGDAYYVPGNIRKDKMATLYPQIKSYAIDTQLKRRFNENIKSGHQQIEKIMILIYRKCSGTKQIIINIQSYLILRLKSNEISGFAETPPEKKKIVEPEDDIDELTPLLR
ncbi:MAG: hypothetical protein Harvfovirus3_17 [Harvfovirus sp.]|uniref:Uncharacterized protein n=1 Tax=Harvfovirus sp. TaxID=2487768 RepID=A0A3G5A092_9VIRU|nr:MAG: hypothetical protein Harvfovirus3_17 [Harvfovirus sp.]